MYEIRIDECADGAEARALNERIERLLCPDPHHASPCPIPWSLISYHDQGDGSGDSCAGSIVGVYASHGQATQVAERIRALVGGQRPVVVREDDAEQFVELIEQYRIEHGLTQD